MYEYQSMSFNRPTKMVELAVGESVSNMTTLHRLHSKEPPRKHPAAIIMRNAKFAAFGVCYFDKLNPESWCIYPSIKLLRMKKIPKDNFTYIS